MTGRAAAGLHDAPAGCRFIRHRNSASAELSAGLDCVNDFGSVPAKAFDGLVPAEGKQFHQLVVGVIGNVCDRCAFVGQGLKELVLLSLDGRPLPLGSLSGALLDSGASE